MCIGTGLPKVLATISSNMDTILSSLRATGFHGVLMVVNYYSLDYTDPGGTAITVLLNQADHGSRGGPRRGGRRRVHGFQAAASTSFAGGKPCRAGLLNASPQNQFTCDVHPSQSGQQLLAATVEGAYRAALAGPGDD